MTLCMWDSRAILLFCSQRSLHTIADDLPKSIPEEQLHPGMPVETFISMEDRTFFSYLAWPLPGSMRHAGAAAHQWIAINGPGNGALDHHRLQTGLAPISLKNTAMRSSRPPTTLMCSRTK